MEDNAQPAIPSSTVLIRIEKIYAANIWIAEIMGTDTKYGYARTFKGTWDNSKSNSKGTRGCFLVAELEEGKIYQICESKEPEYFCTVRAGKYLHLTEEQVHAELEKRDAPVVDTVDMEAAEAETLADELGLPKEIPEPPLAKIAYTQIGRETEKAVLCRIKVPEGLRSEGREPEIWIPRSVIQDWDPTQRHFSLPLSFLASKRIYNWDLRLDCTAPRHFEIIRRLGGVKIGYGTWAMPSPKAWAEANWCIRRPLLAATNGLSEAKLRRNRCTKSGTRWQAPNYATYAKLVKYMIK